MLVLSRRLNERIVLPGIQTAIQVVGIQGGTVRLGIDAPAEVKVFREEVLKEGRAIDAEIREPGEGSRSSLSDTARELSELRRELRGKLPPHAAAVLFRIDRALSDLARRTDPTQREERLTLPASR